MKEPAGQMANSGVNSYEHLRGTEHRAHEGSQSSHPHGAKGKNAGLGEPMSKDVNNLGM
jgi:hypothetical protein